jgi:hypothetical protein
VFSVGGQNGTKWHTGSGNRKLELLIPGVFLCQVARELAECRLDLGGEKVVGWDKGGIETTDVYFPLRRENLIVI